MTRRSQLNLSSEQEIRSEPPTSFRAVDEQLQQVDSQAAVPPSPSKPSRPGQPAAASPERRPEPRTPSATSVAKPGAHQPAWLNAKTLAKALLLLGAAALSIALLVRRGF